LIGGLCRGSPGAGRAVVTDDPGVVVMKVSLFHSNRVAGCRYASWQRLDTIV